MNLLCTSSLRFGRHLLLSTAFGACIGHGSEENGWTTVARSKPSRERRSVQVGRHGRAKREWEEMNCGEGREERERETGQGREGPR